ncbi:hypothetical protein DPMN_035234 [Dreissena polymorpha]|uniref:Uncharacterized protein n=1 Tax=Dreissena polymorpha TaxID=45954 RepID=A0A9D4MBI1_DREPO|nr:hypothetical protein DPMN_035234 [Dreissena polymorpha]
MYTFTDHGNDHFEHYNTISRKYGGSGSAVRGCKKKHSMWQQALVRIYSQDQTSEIILCRKSLKPGYGDLSTEDEKHLVEPRFGSTVLNA